MAALEQLARELGDARRRRRPGVRRVAGRHDLACVRRARPRRGRVAGSAASARRRVPPCGRRRGAAPSARAAAGRPGPIAHVGGELRDERRQRLGGEHVPVARLPERLGEPADLGDQRLERRGGEVRRGEREARAQPSRADAHLVHPLRVGVGHESRRVGGDLLEAGEGDAGERRIGRGVALDLDRVRRARARSTPPRCPAPARRRARPCWSPRPTSGRSRVSASARS